MTRMMKAAALAAVMALAVAQPASAAGCWDYQQAAAAKIRDLQSRLMVATLRCQAMGFDVSPAYNQFVLANKGTIQAANGVIKAQFAAASGGADAERLYDNFATSLANAYGAGETSSEICHQTEAAEQEGSSAGGDIMLLLALADRLGPPPALPGGLCPITFAQR